MDVFDLFSVSVQNVGSSSAGFVWILKLMGESRHGPKSFKDGKVECWCGWTAEAREEIIAQAMLSGHIQHELDSRALPRRLA